MKFHYEQPEIIECIYGETFSLRDRHPVYTAGTLFKSDGRGIVVVQQHFMNVTDGGKYCYWGAVDPDIANRIYLSPNFKDFFEKHAAKPYRIFQLRKLMWALRMKPLKRAIWEDYFSTPGKGSNL